MSWESSSGQISSQATDSQSGFSEDSCSSSRLSWASGSVLPFRLNMSITMFWTITNHTYTSILSPCSEQQQITLTGQFYHHVLNNNKSHLHVSSIMIQTITNHTYTSILSPCSEQQQITLTRQFYHHVLNNNKSHLHVSSIMIQTITNHTYTSILSPCSEQ